LRDRAWFEPSEMNHGLKAIFSLVCQHVFALNQNARVRDRKSADG
jgi:hypothetical protein